MSKIFIKFLMGVVIVLGLASCGSDNNSNNNTVNLNTSLQAARDVGVFITMKEPEYYEETDHSAYGGTVVVIENISTSAVGNTEVEILAALNALRNFDKVIDATTYVGHKYKAHDKVRLAITELNGKLLKLKNGNS